jgi:hypothetical protein
MANSPYNIKLTITAPEKAEYLASGPKFSTACDSNCPGVSENKVWDASSGMNGPPTNDRISSAIAIAINPPNEILVEMVADFSITSTA